ncbi:MAG: 4Fe-4S dicluster domain-containing protein, partial [Kiritimatiellaeota bacterium]|nr:4Fe-4S dicluster domain-containing protein [Kiritimatiellota bacterium]
VKVIARARQAFEGENAIPCTACEYCLPVCPKKLAIPTIFQTYNEIARAKKTPLRSKTEQGASLRETRVAEALAKFKERVPSLDCVSCGACVKRCPQQIPIPKMIKKAGQVF